MYELSERLLFSLENKFHSFHWNIVGIRSASLALFRSLISKSFSLFISFHSASFFDKKLLHDIDKKDPLNFVHARTRLIHYIINFFEEIRMHFDFNKNFANKQTNKTPKITLFEEKKNRQKRRQEWKEIPKWRRNAMWLTRRDFSLCPFIFYLKINWKSFLLELLLMSYTIFSVKLRGSIHWICIYVQLSIYRYIYIRLDFAYYLEFVWIRHHRK